MSRPLLLVILGGAATLANAQSSVTLFGIADASVRHVKNGDTSVDSLSSGGLSSSRLGFRGAEDLGDGLQAGFWLESGFNIDTGTSADTNRFWNRRATVSLTGTFGEVRLGRDTTPTYNGLFEFDPTADVGMAGGGHFFNVLGTTADTNTRADNLVSYFLPSNLGGAYGQLSAAPGEGGSGKKYVGGRLGYRLNSLNVSGAYSQTRVTPLAGAAGEDQYKSFVLGASYDFGPAKLQGYFDQKKYASLKVSTASVSTLVPIGLGLIKIGYVKVNAQGALTGQPSIDANDASQVYLGYVYNLSKRTAVYTNVVRIDNKQRAAYVVATPPALPSPNNGQNSTGYEVGVRHSF
jgi:predicted porin